MIDYRYIRKEWIVSPRARNLYRKAAILSLGLLALPIASSAFPEVLRSETGALLFEIGLFAASMALAATLVGMECFWILLDDSPGLQRFLWFFVLLLVPIGPALYCFRVYSRSSYFKPAKAEHAATSSS